MQGLFLCEEGGESMATDIGARIGIDGEKSFRDSLSAVNAQLKNLGSEMKAVVSLSLIHI